MASDRTIAEMFALLSVAYPDATIDKRTPDVYARLLRDISDDILMAAVEQHMSASKWFPKIAELREAALDIQARAAGILTAEEAWAEVSKQVRAIGSWGVPEFDELTQRAVEGLGGWLLLCQSTNIIADRAHFMKIYASMLQRQQQDANMLPEVRAIIEALQGEQRPQLEGGKHENRDIS